MDFPLTPDKEYLGFVDYLLHNQAGLPTQTVTVLDRCRPTAVRDRVIG